MTTLACLTPTIPGREGLLAEAIASVDAQTVPCQHWVLTDVRRVGPAATRNVMASKTTADWVAFLDDDDLWLPHHVETVFEEMDVGYHDVIYTHCMIEGRPGWDPQRDHFDERAMRQMNYIPLGGVVIRKSMFDAVGGFPDERYEDHGLFIRLLNAGAKFHCLPERTWVYRFGDWDSRSKECWRGDR